MDIIINACNSIWASTIKKMNFDLFNKTIKFDLSLLEKENEISHYLEIRDFESFLWVEKYKTTHEGYDIRNYDYHELTSITFGNFEAKSEDKWLKQYALKYNIAIEIWESALLIKSTTLVIDGEEFHI